MNLVSKYLILFTILIVANCVLASAVVAVEIKLRERATPHGSVVRLSDVAEISGDDREQTRQLGALPLMPAPASGTERFLRKREIQDMLAAQSIEVGDFRFAGPEQVVLVASGVEVEASNGLRTASGTAAPKMNRHAAILAGLAEEKSPSVDEARDREMRQELTRVITSYLNTKTGKAASWAIDCDLAMAELARLDRATSAPICTGGTEPWTGRQRFVLSFSTADGPVQVAILANIQPPPVPMVMAVRPIGRGDVIRAADIELRPIDAPAKKNAQRYGFESVEKLIGMEAKQSIQAGDVVMSDVVQSPILVKRGDLVTVVAQSGGIRVRTSAKALRDGARGDLVQVEAIGSKDKYDVRVTGSRQAAVFAMSRPAAPERQDRDTAWAQHAERLTQKR
jgi:flagella basal body P-ring formation protein FlgA